MFPKLTRLTLKQQKSRIMRGHLLKLGKAWMTHTTMDEDMSIWVSANGGRWRRVEIERPCD